MPLLPPACCVCKVPVDRLHWGKVDIEPTVNTEPGCQFDGLDPATQLETVEIVLIYLLIDIAGRFVADPANQRFTGKYTSLFDIHNRLEGICEIEIQLCQISTVAIFDLCGIFQVHTFLQ